MDRKDRQTGLSAKHEPSLKSPQNRHIFQLLQRHRNPAHAVAAGKSGNCRNHKPIHAAARKLKPTQRGKDKPSNTGSHEQQRLAHARLQPPLARRITNPHQQDDIAAQIQIERQVSTKIARHAQTAKGNRGTDNALPNNPNPAAIKQPHERIKQQARRKQRRQKSCHANGGNAKPMHINAQGKHECLEPARKRTARQRSAAHQERRHLPRQCKNHIRHQQARYRTTQQSRHGFGLNVYPARIKNNGM